MAAKQVVTRDLTLVLADLQKLSKRGGLDPMVAMMLSVMIKLVELLRRQAQAM